MSSSRIPLSHQQRIADRRKEDRSGRPEMALLGGLGALTVLEWIDVPVLAMASDGTVVFSNWAFADMIGYTPEMVRVLSCRHIFEGALRGESPMSIIRAHADLVVDLVHLDGSTVRAKVSEALVLGDDEVAIATFDDMTEALWIQEF